MADDRWTLNFDVYDESDAPTKEGYYRTIDDEGNEITDYYFNEPRMTPRGIGYWKHGTRPIIAWKYLGDTADTPQTDCESCEHKHEMGLPCYHCERSVDCGWGEPNE